MKAIGASLAMVALAIAACSSSDDATGQQQLADYKAHCYAEADAACEKGFQCNSFFVTSQYNSVDHCKSELKKQWDEAATSLGAGALEDCAKTCDVMKSDVEALTCDQFDNATFNQYHCG